MPKGRPRKDNIRRNERDGSDLCLANKGVCNWNYAGDSKKMIDESVKIGSNTRIEPTAIIQKNCVIGDNCSIGHYVIMSPDTKIGNNTTIGHQTVFEGECSVGNYCLIHSQCHITKGAVIEDNVIIAPMFVGSNDNMMLQHRKNLQEIKPNGYHICKGVKIGANVSVLPGVFIGENSIVGVGSVVTRDIPEYSIVHGSPARVRGIVEEEEII